jgi:hypothetical protein
MKAFNKHEHILLLKCLNIVFFEFIYDQHPQIHTKKEKKKKKAHQKGQKQSKRKKKQSEKQ